MTCVAPPKTGLPPTSMGVFPGEGRVVEGEPVGPGCKTFLITCDADGMDVVVIGANQDFISLSEPSDGEKTAKLVCNGDGKLEGRTVDGDSVIVTSFYCSNT
uniref:Uncharacterized protein n=1 Tax=Panagrolaimus sp. ES5 TaxID=591445 RepID=A0AC34FVK3_9BILA